MSETRNLLLCAFVMWCFYVEDGRYRPLRSYQTFQDCEAEQLSRRDHRLLCLPGTLNPNHR